MTPRATDTALDLTEATRAMRNFIRDELLHGDVSVELASDGVIAVFLHIAAALADRVKAEADECHKTMGGGFPAGLEWAAEMLRDLAESERAS